MSEQRNNKGWKNLKTEEHSFSLYDKDRLREISRKGAQATHKIQKEKRNARQALERILSMNVTDEIIYGAELPTELAEQLREYYPDATLYDLMQLVALGRALDGDMRACEYIRDTFGDRPSSKVEVSNSNITTDSDRELMKLISARLNNPDTVIALDVTGKDTDN